MSTTNKNLPLIAKREASDETIAANFERWYRAMEASHSMLMAGLRDRVGPDGDVQQAYRDWLEKHRAEKLRAYEQAAQRYRDRLSAIQDRSHAT